MRRAAPPALLAALAALVLPAPALGAQVKINPRATAVSPAGATTVQVSNPTRHALSGRATMTVGRRTIATRSVRLGRRSVTRVRLRFDRNGLVALQRARGRATLTLRVRRSGGRTTTVRRTLTLRSAGGAGPGGPTGQAPTGGGSTGAAPPPAPAAPPSNRWIGRLGTEGTPGDLELTVVDGQMHITKPFMLPVTCFEIGGAYRMSLSLELFDAPGPWAIGTERSESKQAVAVNQLVTGSPRTITYTVAETAQAAGQLSGRFRMSFSHSTYDFFTNSITFINCSGTSAFEAVPAG
jgi:hypothetical protein